MTQFVYWYAPLWQVVMVAMAGLLLLAWLLLLVGRRPKTSPTLAAVDPALDDQPVIYFDPVRGFIALNRGAEALLHELHGRRTDELQALADALLEVQVEARASQLDTIIADQTLVAVPVFGQPGQVSGVLAMITAQAAQQAPAPVLATAEAPHAGTEEGTEDWMPLGPALRIHPTRELVQVRRVEAGLTDDAAAWQENQLTGLENRLLRCLLQHPHQTQPALTIFAWMWPDEEVVEWGLRPDQADRLRRLIFNLRQKIEVNPSAPRHLCTVHGLGYALYVDQKDAAP